MIVPTIDFRIFNYIVKVPCGSMPIVLVTKVSSVVYVVCWVNALMQLRYSH